MTHFGLTQIDGLSARALGLPPRRRPRPLRALRDKPLGYVATKTRDQTRSIT